VTEEIKRSYLEITSLDQLTGSSNPSKDCVVELVEKPDFQLNKFFYKNVGKNHRWVDRLIWSELEWIQYISNPNLKTFILKHKKDLAGYYEIIFHPDKNEKEIAYFGLLEEYRNKGLGSFFLSQAIKSAFNEKIKRLWLHTCTFDHKNALNNYLSRGMKVFKEETLKI
jgi:GNAT superfamily N-acetyltransferase